MVVNLHGKRICSKGVEPRAKFLYLGKRDPHGSQLPKFHWSAFTQEQFNLVLFGRCQLTTRTGLASARPSAEGKAVRMAHALLMAVETSSWCQCLLGVHLRLCCLADLAVFLASASQINYSTDHPAFWDFPWRWQRSRRFFS